MVIHDIFSCISFFRMRKTVIQAIILVGLRTHFETIILEFQLYTDIMIYH